MLAKMLDGLDTELDVEDVQMAAAAELASSAVGAHSVPAGFTKEAAGEGAAAAEGSEMSSGLQFCVSEVTGRVHLYDDSKQQMGINFTANELDPQLGLAENELLDRLNGDHGGVADVRCFAQEWASLTVRERRILHLRIIDPPLASHLVEARKAKSTTPRKNKRKRQEATASAPVWICAECGATEGELTRGRAGAFCGQQCRARFEAQRGVNKPDPPAQPPDKPPDKLGGCDGEDMVIVLGSTSDSDENQIIELE